MVEVPTVESVNQWIQTNLLDSSVWDNFAKQDVAIIQAIRNLQRWYPDTELDDELVAYQVIWEIKSIDPALKYQKQGVKSVADGGDRIDYGENVRDKVATEVRDVLGLTVDEKELDTPLYGGCLL